jgi:hypothetical protein
MARPFELAGRTAVVATMHGKERVIEPALAALGLKFLPVPLLDTDRFGTFTRDVARAASQREALLAKARTALELVPEADFAVASEGAFGPHPQIPFVPAGLELVGLVARASDNAVIGRDLSTATNFAQVVARDRDDVARFADRIGLPDHAIVALAGKDGPVLAKGLTSPGLLFEACAPLIARQGSVWLEADMRAHVNPTRMRAIGRAAADLVSRLEARCPACSFPDWLPRTVAGRPCSWCGEPTWEAWRRQWQCKACGHRDERVIDAGRQAEPGNCLSCNP